MDVKSSPYAVDGVPRRVCLFLWLAAPGSTGDGSSRPMSVARRTRRCLRGGPLELAGQFRGRAARADQLDYLTPLLRRVRGMSFRHRNTSCPQSESVHHIGANPAVPQSRQAVHGIRPHATSPVRRKAPRSASDDGMSPMTSVKVRQTLGTNWKEMDAISAAWSRGTSEPKGVKYILKEEISLWEPNLTRQKSSG